MHRHRHPNGVDAGIELLAYFSQRFGALLPGDGLVKYAAHAVLGRQLGHRQRILVRRIGMTMDVDGAGNAADRRRILHAALVGAADFIGFHKSG